MAEELDDLLTLPGCGGLQRTAARFGDRMTAPMAQRPLGDSQGAGHLTAGCQRPTAVSRGTDGAAAVLFLLATLALTAMGTANARIVYE